MTDKTTEETQAQTIPEKEAQELRALIAIVEGFNLAEAVINDGMFQGDHTPQVATAKKFLSAQRDSIINLIRNHSYGHLVIKEPNNDDAA